ncbi:MAG: beta-N-acetylhexosaminidase [Oscillospiraceae bacterium]
MIKGLSDKQKQGMAFCYPNGFEYNGEIAVCNGGKGIELDFDNDCCHITLAKPSLLWRALMLLQQQVKEGKKERALQEPCYRDLGIMIDCSRNAVLKISAFKQMAIMLAKMGYTVIQLYMEDTFEVEKYPYFGYRRGGYTQNELSEMDTFADTLGIELIPAVQTLAHLGQSLKWDTFSDIVDFGDILLADEDKTYELLDSIFCTLSKSFTSRRINIGMDEAHMVGLGKYLDKHGYQSRIDVMLKHFTKVHELAAKYGFKPMLWSDMFFRLASGGDYYAPDCVIDPKIKQFIPDDTTLVYWDYYSESSEIYNRMLDSHAKMSDNIIFAGGAWKWTGFNPNNQFSMKIANLAHESCKAHSVNEVLVTAWGDNGAECSVFAILPALQYWAELCYSQDATEDSAQRFALCTDGKLDDFLLLDKPTFTPNNPLPGGCAVNPTKYTLYQDIMEGLFDAHIEPESFSAHYADCAKALKGNFGEWQAIFDAQQALCEVLELKCRAGIDIRKAYFNTDSALLLKYKDEILPLLLRRTERFAQLYHIQWKLENKIEGLDIFDIKIGGLMQRIKSACERINDYLNGDILTLDELETPVLPYSVKKSEAEIQEPMWHKIVSASTIALI